MHSNFNKLEAKKAFIDLLKSNEYKDDFINFILNLNDKDSQSSKENFNKNADLLTAMSEKRCNRANEYILDKFFNIKTHEGKYTFLKDENSMYFELYKEFIIVLLNQGFNDDHLLEILNQLSFHIDRTNRSYHVDDSQNYLGSYYAYGGHIDFNKYFLKYKDVFTTFFRYFLPHSYNYSNACKALMNIGYTELDKYKNNLSLFRLLAQNSFSCRVIEREYMTVKNEHRDYFRMMHSDFDFFRRFHHDPRLNVVDSLFSMADYKEINISNNKELLDLLFKENLITLSQDKKDFVTGNPIVSYLLKVDRLTILELVNDSLAEMTEKVKELTQARLKEVQSQSTLPNTHHAKAPNLAEQVIEKLRCNQNEVPSLIALSIGAILNPQEKKILEKPQIEKIKATREERSNRCCNIL